MFCAGLSTPEAHLLAPEAYVLASQERDFGACFPSRISVSDYCMSTRNIIIHWDEKDVSEGHSMRREVYEASVVINEVIKRAKHVQRIHGSYQLKRLVPKPDVIIVHVPRFDLGNVVLLIDPDDNTMLYGAQKSQCVDDVWQDIGRKFGFRHVKKHPVGTFD